MRILIVFIVILVAILLFSVSDEKISKRAKFALTFALIAIGLAAYIFESGQESEQERRLQTLALFNQGKNLKCAKFDVNNTKFNYEFGTASFVAKRGAKELSSVKIAIDECEAEK